MSNITVSEEEFQSLKEMIKQFKEIDGDNEKSLELEDFYNLVDIARTINSIIEPSLNI